MRISIVIPFFTEEENVEAMLRSKLQRIELLINAAVPDKLLMLALLDEAALIEHYDQVGTLDGG